MLSHLNPTVPPLSTTSHMVSRGVHGGAAPVQALGVRRYRYRYRYRYIQRDRHRNRYIHRYRLEESKFLLFNKPIYCDNLFTNQFFVKGPVQQ